MNPEVYDRTGRMEYNPDFHFNQGERWTESDLEYLCKYIEIDGYRSVSFALGRTEKTIASKIADFKKNGKYEYYKNLNKYW